MPTLDIIIVNWNSGNQLYRCIKSIENALNKNFILNKIIIVDNASIDDSLTKIYQIKTLPIQIIRNSENKGFAFACNQGARGSQVDYLLFLNPDTELFANSLVDPIMFMENKQNSKVGIVGIQLLNKENSISKSCARFPEVSQYFVKMLGLNKVLYKRFPPRLMEEWDHRNTRVVDQVIGAFFLVRNSLFNNLKGFDERFFVYYEEVDFSFRAFKEGFISVYLTSAQAFHKGGGTSEQIKAKRLFYSLRSRIQYGYKHFGYVKASLLVFGTLFIEPISRLGLGMLKLSLEYVIETIEAYHLLWKDILKKYYNRVVK